MPRAIALKLDSQTATAIVARLHGRRVAIDGVVRVAIDGDEPSLKSAAERLARQLDRLGAAKLPVVAALGRSALAWQVLELPPAPAADLPDLVRMLAQRDLTIADDGLGFDYLPLSGSDSTPWKVLAVSATSGELQRVQQICADGRLSLTAIVPEPFGWPALMEAVGADPQRAAAAERLQIGVAGATAVLWSGGGSSLAAIRSALLPHQSNASDSSAPDRATTVAVLASEIRRTLLSLSGERSTATASPTLEVIAERGDELAEELSRALKQPVHGRCLADLLEFADDDATGGLAAAEVAPLAGLAAAASSSRQPPLDLFHPRRRAAPPSRRRTYALAAVAATAAAAWAAFGLWRNLQAPLAAAAATEAELKLMEPELASRAIDEKQAAAIQNWLDEGSHVLLSLDAAGRALRPKTMAESDYPVDQDVLAAKFVVANRKTTLSLSARKSEAVLPAEERLRKAGFTVDSSGPLEFSSKIVADYPVTVTLTVEKKFDLAEFAASEKLADSPATSDAKKGLPAATPSPMANASPPTTAPPSAPPPEKPTSASPSSPAQQAKP